LTGLLKGLRARAIVVMAKSKKKNYTGLVPEITQEPDYEAELDVL